MQQLRRRVEVWRPDLRLVEPTPPLDTSKSEGAGKFQAVAEEYQAVIDETLQLVHAQYYRATSRLNPHKVASFTLGELREGPLGKDLGQLAQFAQGTLAAKRQTVLGAIESVLQLLFRS